MFKNFKKTWWIILLMFIEILVLTTTSASIDYVLNHKEQFKEFLQKETESGYKYETILLNMHSAYIVCLLFSLAIIIWCLLWKLYDKKTKKTK